MSIGDVCTGVLATLLGLVVGSFLNVVIYRLPRGQSIVWPASRCPACGHAIRWQHNVPLVGWFILRGRCADCGGRIAWRYPLVEALTAGAFLLAICAYGVGPAVLVAWAFLAVLIAVAFIDLDHRIIPDRIVLPAALVGLVASVGLDPTRWWQFLVAGVAASGFLFLLGLVWAGGMGFGDVKLALLMGFILGPLVIVAMFAAFLLGGLAGVTLLALGLKTRKDKVAFGPYLAAGAAVALLWGEPILKAYVGFYR